MRTNIFISILLVVLILAGCASTIRESRVYRYEPELPQIKGLVFNRAGINYKDTCYYYGSNPAIVDTILWEDILLKSKKGSIYRILEGLDIYIEPGDSMTLILGHSWKVER